jgi:hypothetical protein
MLYWGQWNLNDVLGVDVYWMCDDANLLSISVSYVDVNVLLNIYVCLLCLNLCLNIYDASG